MKIEDREIKTSAFQRQTAERFLAHEVDVILPVVGYADQSVPNREGKRNFLIRQKQVNVVTQAFLRKRVQQPRVLRRAVGTHPPCARIQGQTFGEDILRG